jgi:hypothetical protein
MNAIKALEKIGQSTSKKHFATTEDMLDSLNIDNKILPELKKCSTEFICSVHPEDDKVANDLNIK